MEVVGKVILAFPEVSGTSKAGNPWKKRDYVLETQETYPRKIAFDFFGERVDQFPLQIGDTIKLSFDIESREYQGRWYTSIRGWKSEPYVANAPVPGAVPPGEAFPEPLATPQYGTQPAAPTSFPSAPAAPQPGAPQDDLPF